MTRFVLMGASLAALALGVGACLGNDNPGGDDVDASTNGNGNGNGDGNGNGNGDGEPDASTELDADLTPDADEGDDNGDALANHLVITEVMARGVDFIEIWNPTDDDIDLSNYYLSDSQVYAVLAEDPEDPSLGNGFDFVVKFPDTTTIGADQVIVVAVNADEFETAEDPFGFAPDYTIEEPADPASSDAVTMTPIKVGGSGSFLRDDGEGLVLFTWDGDRPLVQDVDMMVHGVVTAESDDEEPEEDANNIVDKTGLEPTHHSSGASEPYADDDFTLGTEAGQFEAPSPDDCSYRRVAVEYAVEEDGNGIDGHDATSQNMRDSWDNQADVAPEECTVTPRELPEELRDSTGS